MINSGKLNVLSYMELFGVVIRFGYWVYVLMAVVTAVIFALAVFQPGRSTKPEQSSASAAINSDPQNLWDEQ